jgi:hypothetical protein
MGRRQLEIEEQLIAQGMPPREAAMTAARTVMQEDAPSVSAGNGAEVDNLEAAATPIEMEASLGRIAPPQSERVYQDDPTMGMAGMVAAREDAAAQNWAARGEYYDAKEQEQAALYGPYGVSRDELTNAQKIARGERAQLEADVRHNPREEEARIRRLADRAGIPYAQAEAMVQAGYNREAERMQMPSDSRWQVATPGNPTETPEFSTFSAAHKDLRQMGSDRRAAEKAARQQAVQRMRMAQTNPLEYMNRGDISDWNRMVTADQLLRRGYRGATPLDVDQATQQALALQESRRAITEGLRPQTEGQERLVNAKADQAEREANPEAAGIADIQQGVYESGPARTLLETLGRQYDDVWLGGANRTRKPELVDRLTKPPYNLPPEQASQAADFALRQTDWW